MGLILNSQIAGGTGGNESEGRRGTRDQREGETAGGEGKPELWEGGAEMNMRRRGRKEP